VRLSRDRKLLILIFILLVTCLLIIGGCGKKAAPPETNKESERTQETFQREERVSEGQEDVVQEESIDKAVSLPKAEDSKTISHTESSANVKGQGDASGNANEATESYDSESISSVTLSILGPEDIGVILEATEVEIEEGETVIDVLKKAASQNNIPVSVRGRKSTAYVEGINNLFEFDRGPKSGWLYRVNGSLYSKSAGTFTVNAGDVIEWLYTLDLGRDIEGNVSFSGGAADE